MQLPCFCFGLANCHFAEGGAKRKKGKLDYQVRRKNRKIIQQARENLPKDRLLRFTVWRCLSLERLLPKQTFCLESAARESVDLGRDSNCLGSQNLLRSSSHRVLGEPEESPGCRSKSTVLGSVGADCL